jgi:hypothetical protein
MLLLVVTVIVELPDPVTEVGLKLSMTPAGGLPTLKFTGPLRPFTAATVTV